MFLGSRRLGVSPLVTGPLLVLTILLSPIGLVVLLVIRGVRKSPSRPAPSA